MSQYRRKRNGQPNPKWGTLGANPHHDPDAIPDRGWWDERTTYLAPDRRRVEVIDPDSGVARRVRLPIGVPEAVALAAARRKRLATNRP